MAKTFNPISPRDMGTGIPRTMVFVGASKSGCVCTAIRRIKNCSLAWPDR